MDLFSSIIDSTTVDSDIDTQVTALCDFVKSLDSARLKTAAAAREAISFDTWHPAITSFQEFAYSHELKDDWWRIVEIVSEARKGTWWTAAWDAAYDHSMCLLLKPYVGRAIPQPHYDLLTGPLSAVGWKFKKVS